MRDTPIGGARCFITFIDDFSRKMRLYVLRSKNECLEKFMEFKTLLEMQSGYKIKTLWSNNEGEVVSKALNCFWKDHSIESKTNPPYTFQQNGVAEHANQIIVEMERGMLQDLDASFRWMRQLMQFTHKTVV